MTRRMHTRLPSSCMMPETHGGKQDNVFYTITLLNETSTPGLNQVPKSTSSKACICSKKAKPRRRRAHGGTDGLRPSIMRESVAAKNCSKMTGALAPTCGAPELYRAGPVTAVRQSAGNMLHRISLSASLCDPSSEADIPPPWWLRPDYVRAYPEQIASCPRRTFKCLETDGLAAVIPYPAAGAF